MKLFLGQNKRLTQVYSLLSFAPVLFSPELSDLVATVAELSNLLNGVAIGLKGPAGEVQCLAKDWNDLPEIAARFRTDLEDALRAREVLVARVVQLEKKLSEALRHK